jgi:glycosyltransferase involved in cell wall biosynthesis
MCALRVLHCPYNVGGHPQGLASAERELGLRSWAVSLNPSFFEFEIDEQLAKPQDSRIALELKRMRLLWRAMRDYDVIHFNFGQAILPSPLHGVLPGETRSPAWMRRIYRWYAQRLDMRDLLLLKKAGKKIFVTFQGNDARQGDYCASNFAISIAAEVGRDYYPPEADAAKRRVIARFARFADRIFFLNPDLGHVLPAEARFLPYAHVDPREWRPPAHPSDNGRPLVLHAPSSQLVKGTKYVLEAVVRLSDEGVAFDFELVEGLTHREARKVYERADLVVDQLLAGWYGGIAVELMALGKPVVAYMREEDLAFVPSAMREELPIIAATPATLHDVLKEWLTVRRQDLAEIGSRSRAYVERWHDPIRIAAELKREYESAFARGDSY